jgi:hypothetical protein
MAGIFVSYRRDDCPGDVLRVVERLERSFPPELVFVDVTHIDPGGRFLQEIENRIVASDIVLVAIGPRWLTAGEGGARRLDNPDDVVRREVALALRSNIVLLPALFGDARMPKPDDLPEEISELAARQALSISAKHFDADVCELLKVIKRRFAIPRSPLRRWFLLYRPHRGTVARGWVLRGSYYLVVMFAIVQAIGLPAAHPWYGKFQLWIGFWVRLSATVLALVLAIVLHRTAYWSDVNGFRARR